MKPFDDMHVSLFGLEHYGAGIDSLDGPAQQVLQLARWAIGKGVTPTEVVVFLSEPAGRDQATVTELRALDVPDANIRAATFENVRTYCVNDLRQRTARNLLWFWSGHGFLFRPTYNRVLYAADTSLDDHRVWDVPSILRYLRSTTIEGLDRQLVLFNVCAEGTGSDLETVTLPNPKHYKNPIHVEAFYQDAISAAPDEQFVRTGDFADLVHRQLGARDPDAVAWPPPTLAADLKREAPGTFNLAFGHDTEPGDELERPEIQRELKDYLEKEEIVAFVGGHARGPECSDQTAIAEMLANSDDVRFPFPDTKVLSQVAEFLARRGQNHDPERRLARTLEELADETRLADARRNRLRRLARLPIKVYITTAYDSLLEEALRLEGRRAVPMSYATGRNDGPEPTIDEPIVFHLYGRVRPTIDGADPPAVSEFDIHKRNRLLAADGIDHDFFPPQVRGELQHRHLYVGFDLQDRTLRGVLHALQETLGKGSYGYAIEPTFELAEGGDEREARAFIDRYLTDIGPCQQVRVLWDFPHQLVDEITEELAGVAN